MNHEDAKDTKVKNDTAAGNTADSILDAVAGIEKAGFSSCSSCLGSIDHFSIGRVYGRASAASFRIHSFAENVSNSNLFYLLQGLARPVLSTPIT